MHCSAIRGKTVSAQTDLILTAKDRDGKLQQIQCHQLIMFVASPVIEHLMKYQERKGPTKAMKINVEKEMTFETLKTIVDYCYTGEIKLTELNHERMLAAAEFLGIVRIIERCQRSCEILRSKDGSDNGSDSM